MNELHDLVREWVAAEHAATEARTWADGLKGQIRSLVEQQDQADVPGALDDPNAGFGS